jgi:hypothetical protein
MGRSKSQDADDPDRLWQSATRRVMNHRSGMGDRCYRREYRKHWTLPLLEG